MSDSKDEQPKPNPLRWTYLWFFGIANVLAGFSSLGGFAVVIAFDAGGMQHLRSRESRTPSGLNAREQPVRYWFVAMAWFVLALIATSIRLHNDLTWR